MKGLVLNATGKRAPAEGLTERDIPSDATSKEYADFRDRAAYVHVTGTYPTHVRQYFLALLRAATTSSKGKASLDGRSGHTKITDNVVSILRLEEHPMVRKVRSFIEQGFVISQPSNVKDRRPYGRVDLVNPASHKKVSVKSDGSVTEG